MKEPSEVLTKRPNCGNVSITMPSIGASAHRRIGASAHRRIGASALVGVLAALCPASVHLVNPADTPPPLYFTSTNARASARAWLSSPSEGIETFKIKLNGEQVYSKTFPYTPGELHSQWQAHVMFDSTHWGASQTSCTVRLEVTEFGDPTVHASEVTVPIKNMAKQYEVEFNNPWPAASVVVEDKMSAMGYPTHTHTKDWWTRSQFLAEMQGASHEYYHGHGSASPAFEDDSTSGLPIYPGDVEAYRLGQMGTGLPPFNPTGQPPIAFAFIHACCAATGNSFNVFNLPYANHYGGWMEDKCITGFAADFFAQDGADFAEMYYSELASGKTVQQARFEVFLSKRFFVGLPGSSGEVQFEEAHMPIWGDHSTKLKGVYSPFPLSNALQFSRVLQG